MHTIFLSKADQSYLQKCATEVQFTYGLIIGQHVEAEKYIVVHLAKNAEEDLSPTTQLYRNLHGDEDDYSFTQGVHRLEDIDTQSLVNQWISANKMTPGSFSILGIFLASTKDDVIDNHSFNNAKKLLDDVHNLLNLSRNDSSSLNVDFNTEYILLAYSTTAKQAVSKLYTNLSGTGGIFSPMDCRFAEKPFEWYTFECNYDMDDTFPILESTRKLDIERQFQKSVNAVRMGLRASEVWIQNESVANDMLLDAFVKKKNQLHKQQKNVDRNYKATIFLPIKCRVTNGDTVKVREFRGAIRFVGVVSSRIWCNPKTTMGAVKRLICDDILRSLTARIQVYCDGLTDANVSNDALFISEPPRRIYFSLTSGAAINTVQFSEYIFRGEALTVAVASAKQILDLDINTEDIVDDLESLPDDDVFSGVFGDSSDTNIPMTQRSFIELNRNMYMLGIAVALLVLLLAVLLHLVMKTN